MSKDDKLDPSRAAAFAWRFTRPGEENDVPDGVLSEAQETMAGDGQGGEATAGQDGAAPPSAPTCDENDARDGCAALLAELDGIRRMAEAGQAGVLVPLEQLLRHAGELGRELCAVEGYPWQSTRLRRLAHGCRYLLDEDWEDAWNSSLWEGDPELLELQVEVARAGALASLAALMVASSDGRWPAVARFPGAIARIAQVIDDAPSQIACCIAVDASTSMG